MLLLIALPQTSESRSCLPLVTWFLVKRHAGKPQQDVPTLSALTIAIVSVSNDIICPLPPHPLEVIDCDVSGTCWHMWPGVKCQLAVPVEISGCQNEGQTFPLFPLLSLPQRASHVPLIQCDEFMKNTDYLENRSLDCSRQTEWITKHVFFFFFERADSLVAKMQSHNL